MNERLLELRKKLGLTQAQFGAKVQLKGNTVSDLEKGKNKISDRVVADICREFNVNEVWLREGVGPMFRPAKTINNELSAEIGKLIASEDDITKQIVLRYLQLPGESKEKFMAFIRSLDK